MFASSAAPGLFSNEPCMARNIDSCGIAAAVVSISAGSTLGSVTCPKDDHSPCMSSNKHHLHNHDLEIHYRRNWTIWECECLGDGLRSWLFVIRIVAA
jgi:hypothetical protein